MPDISPNLIVDSETLSGLVRDALLQKDHGLWFQEIVDVDIRKDGSNIRSVLQGVPIRTREFRALYGYEAEDEFPHNPLDMVVKDDKNLVVATLNRAKSSEGKAATCTVRMITKSGQEKIIEVYARRICIGGKTYLASLHSDLTVDNEWHRIRKTALDQLPGIVFVKKWDTENGKFIFVYINKTLADIFSIKDASIAEGLSDDYFLADSEQISAYAEDDFVIRDTTDANTRIVREENFTLKDRATGLPSGAARLVTIKMPYPQRPAKGSNCNSGNMVLGISFDITSVTTLLRTVLSRSEDAIYIKDSQKRYILANPQFITLMGLPSGYDVKGKTYEQIIPDILRQRSEPFASQSRVDESLRRVQREDELLLTSNESAEIEYVGPAIFNNNKHWHTRKALTEIPHSQLLQDLFRPDASRNPASHKYILGISRSLFGGVDAAFFSRVPQCICVKDQELNYVWCNDNFAKHHNRQPDSIIGCSDKDLWPEHLYGERISGDFRDKDECVRGIGEKYVSISKKECRAFRDYWPQILEELREFKCIEFRESQPSIEGTNTRSLQTTKWPEYIAGRLFVVVVYSDVTEGDVELMSYHRMTVHTLRSALTPIESASDVMGDEIASMPLDPSRLIEIARVLKLGVDRTQWFFGCHLKFLRPSEMQSKFAKVETRDMLFSIQTATNETRAMGFGRMSTNFLDNLPEEAYSTYISGDMDFLKAVVYELLRNSYKAILNRRDYEKARYREENPRSLTVPAPYTGTILVNVSIVGPNLRVRFTDDGVATVDTSEKAKLSTAFSHGHSNASIEPGKFGIAFCRDVISRHEGRLYLHSESTKGTVLVMELPIRYEPKSRN